VRSAYLIDTNIISLALKGRSSRAAERIVQTPRSKIGLSIITEMELRFGLAKHPHPHRIKPVLDELFDTITVHQLPDDIGSVYGSVRAEFERLGRPIGPLDTIIAAHAIALGAVLVTNNVKEFGRVRGLRSEDWTR
jgi:tRNA(fMet)-specific endonuclease VapC